jgi:hypothetical protein
MRKVKVNYDQILDVIAMHLEALGAISKDEHVNISPLNLDKNNMITIYTYRNKGEIE